MRRYQNQNKEKFSEVFVRAVAAVAGVTVAREEPDVNAEDLLLGTTRDHGMAGFPKVAVQLKATADQTIRHLQDIHFALDRRSYDLLRTETLVPRILVVVLLPENTEDWVVLSEEEMCLRHAAYWCCLASAPDTNNIDSVTVRLPRANTFTPDALQDILERIGRKEQL